MAADAEAPHAQSRLRVALTILFHSSCAIWSTLVSKSALNSIESPVLLLTLQFSVQVVLLTAIGVPTRWIQPVKSLSTWRSILPLCLARMVGILAKTFCLASIDASFYQIARGLLLPFTLLLSLAVLRPMPYFPPLSLAGCAAVMLGFAAGMATDFNAKLTGTKGLFLGVFSSFTTAVESVVVKKYLTSGSSNKEDGMGVWQMVWMSNVLSVVLFLPLLLFSGETGTLAAVASAVRNPPDAAAIAAATSVDGREFLRLALLTGLAGFLLTIATFMQIEVTSPTTHMIVTAARGVAQSGLAVVFLREPVTTGRVTSMALILGGSALYGWAKDRFAHRKAASGGGGEQAYRPVPDDDDDAAVREKAGDLERRASAEKSAGASS